MDDDEYIKRDGRGKTGISNNSNKHNPEHIPLIKKGVFFVPLGLRVCTMYFLGALTAFLATAEATVTADVIVRKLNHFKNSALWLENPARFITPLDAVLDDFKTGPAFVRPLSLPGRF